MIRYHSIGAVLRPALHFGGRWRVAVTVAANRGSEALATLLGPLCSALSARSLASEGDHVGRGFGQAP